MANYTLKPYEVNRFECGCRIVAELRGGLGCKTIRYCPQHSAAPSMYEALKKIADNYGGCHCDHTTNECCESPAVGEFCPHCIAELALAKVEVRQ